MTYRMEIIGSATLYLGDCREILPMLGKFDAAITDPPYGKGYARYPAKVKTTGSWESKHGHSDWDDQRPDQETLAAILEISNQTIIWGGNYFSDLLPATQQWLIWDKGQRGFSLADCEIAWSSQDRASRIFDFSRAKAREESEKVHPTQKPVALMEWCITQLPAASRSIFDPYMGSGSTGVAAAKMQRHFTGIESTPKYFDIACRRIDEAQRQHDMFHSLGGEP